MLYRFSRWQPLQRNSTSGFRSRDVALFGMSVSISSPNVVVITQSAAEKQLFPVSKTQTSAILEFYFRFRFRPYYRSRHVILHQSAKFYPENDVMSIFKMADLRHVGFQGSNNGFLKSLYTTSYRSSIETIARNYLVFEKIAFLHFRDRQTDRQTDKQTFKQTDGQAHCIKPLSLLRAAA